MCYDYYMARHGDFTAQKIETADSLRVRPHGLINFQVLLVMVFHVMISMNVSLKFIIARKIRTVRILSETSHVIVILDLRKMNSTKHVKTSTSAPLKNVTQIQSAPIL